MKTKAIYTAILVIITITTNIFSASAQTSSDFFFDKKYQDEKVISSTKYELGYSGLYEKKHLSEYSYDEWGRISKKLTFHWNSKKSEWIPNYSIEYGYSLLENSFTAEYATWNKKENKYNDASERAIYQMDTLGSFLSCTFVKVQANGIEKLAMQWVKRIDYLAM
jgi:hypothetical protein